jgi:putative endonuclease
MRKEYFVYILASKRNGTLYTGMTSDLSYRIGQHKEGLGSRFTSKYRIHLLVHAETYDDPQDAIRREKNLKAWKRAWKLRLIEKTNPDWRDISFELFN